MSTVPMFTLRRTKGIRSFYASSIDPAGNITGFSHSESVKVLAVDEATAKKVCDAHRAKFDAGGAKVGRLDVFDASGKIVASVGEAGEEPKPVAPPVSLPGVAEELAELKLRVEMIEEVDASSAKPQFTDDEVKAIKAMLTIKAATAAAKDAKPEAPPAKDAGKSAPAPAPAA